eukprot:SAG31_NODE_11672_length_1007_cov_9.667401_1_plen_25_part_10
MGLRIVQTVTTSTTGGEPTFNKFNK